MYSKFQKFSLWIALDYKKYPARIYFCVNSFPGTFKSAKLPCDPNNNQFETKGTILSLSNQ